MTFMLKRAGPYTVFAPTDVAFAKLPAGRLEEIESDPAALRQFVLSHIVRGRFSAESALMARSIRTLAGGHITFANARGRGMIGGGVHFSVPNVVTSNGLIQGIDGVLTPSPDAPGFASRGPLWGRTPIRVRKSPV